MLQQVEPFGFLALISSSTDAAYIRHATQQQQRRRLRAPVCFFLLMLSLQRYAVVYAVYGTKQAPCAREKNLTMNPITVRMGNINDICIPFPSQVWTGLTSDLEKLIRV